MSACGKSANWPKRRAGWPNWKRANHRVPTQRRLRAEAIRLLVAKGRLVEALAAAGAAVDDDDAGAADLDFARLEVLVALWQRAG